MIMISHDLIGWSACDQVLINDQDLVPALLVRRLHQAADPAQLLGKDRRWHRAVTPPVTLPAEGSCGIHDHQYCGQPSAARQVQVLRAPHRIQPQRVDHRHQRTLGPGRNDLIE
jgi:hypothetical protein